MEGSTPAMTVDQGKPELAAKTAIPAGQPVSLDRFLRSLAGTEYAIWGKLLRAEAVAKTLTAEAWHAMIAEIATRPAHPADARFRPDATKARPAPANPRRKAR